MITIILHVSVIDSHRLHYHPRQDHIYAHLYLHIHLYPHLQVLARNLQSQGSERGALPDSLASNLAQLACRFAVYEDLDEEENIFYEKPTPEECS